MDDDHFEDPIQELERRVESLSGIGDDLATQRKREQLELELQALRTKVFASRRRGRRPRRAPPAPLRTRSTTSAFSWTASSRFTATGAMPTMPRSWPGSGSPRPARAGAGTPEGSRYEREDLQELRHAAPGGISQGVTRDATRREVPPPDPRVHRHPGAYPGIGAEERGQAEAIALNLRGTAIPGPGCVTVTGEGGSGGALAIGVGDSVNMLEFAVYSVISPEGCAAILWRDATRSRDAARAMKMTAPDLLSLDVADEIVLQADRHYLKAGRQEEGFALRKAPQVGRVDRLEFRLRLREGGLGLQTSQVCPAIVIRCSLLGVGERRAPRLNVGILKTKVAGMTPTTRWLARSHIVSEGVAPASPR
jgi:hypothetical protein